MVASRGSSEASRAVQILPWPQLVSEWLLQRKSLLLAFDKGPFIPYKTLEMSLLVFAKNRNYFFKAKTAILRPLEDPQRLSRPQKVLLWVQKVGMWDKSVGLITR